jgi:hypothetical protein
MTIYFGKYQYHRSNDGESYAQILVLLGIERDINDATINRRGEVSYIFYV